MEAPNQSENNTTEQLLALLEHYFEILSTISPFLPTLFQDFTNAIGKALRLVCPIMQIFESFKNNRTSN